MGAIDKFKRDSPSNFTASLQHLPPSQLKNSFHPPTSGGSVTEVFLDKVIGSLSNGDGYENVT